MTTKTEKPKRNRKKKQAETAVETLVATTVAETAEPEKPLDGGTVRHDKPVEAPRKAPKPSAEKITKVVEDLFFIHGINVTEWVTDWPVFLAEAGMTPDMVTPTIIKKAKKGFDKRVKEQAAPKPAPVATPSAPEKDEFRLVFGTARVEETEVSRRTVWVTDCGRYRVVRTVPKLSGDTDAGFCPMHSRLRKADGKTVWSACETTKAGDCKIYKDIRQAFDSCKSHLAGLAGKAPEDVTSNAGEVVEEATRNGVHKARGAEVEEEVVATAPKTPKEKKTPVGKTDGVDRDIFGSRKNSQAAIINASLSKTTPKTAKDVATATGLGAGRIQGHLKYLVENGFAVKGDQGYVLA